MRSSLPIIERAKPLLGTYVRLRVQGLASERAQEAMDKAFGEIGRIHTLMSFHEPDSDVSRLNREAHRGTVRVDTLTAEVLTQALRLSDESEGVFDITVAPQLVSAGLLPRPSAPAPDPNASWRDIALLPDTCVRFRRPLWIDLGGIAKGFAVDRAVEVLLSFGAKQVCVNAGGDLRVAGPGGEAVKLQGGDDERFLPVLEIADGSLASSRGGHFERVHRRPARADRFVSVMAPRCIDADGLAKVVMIEGRRAEALLRRHGARAVFHEPGSGWSEVA